MKLLPLLIFVAVYAAGVAANIHFSFIPPSCNNSADCLSGQACTQDLKCVLVKTSLLAVEDASPPRSDGRCGKDFDDSTCDADGPYGPCCSSHSYCGKTREHYLIPNGCQSGCTDGVSPTSSLTTTPLDEPTLSRPTASASASASGAVTTDGTCGAAHGGTVCGNWKLGSCCSMYGFCGDTSAHCGPGCQSRPCNQAPIPAAPGPSPAPRASIPGSFNVVGDSGVPAMHAALLSNGRVVFLDKVENYTKLHLSNGEFAYSSEYDPVAKNATALAYNTNAFCSGGSFLANGTLINVGGNAPLTWLDPTVGDGFRGLRYLTRSITDDSLDGDAWQEPGNELDTPRWYASSQILPDGTTFVASGSKNGLDPGKPENNNPTYEILDQGGISQGSSIDMELLVKVQPYYMYPFIHLLRDGTIFVFASKLGEVFDVSKNQVVKQFNELPGLHRNYPNTGASALLPLSSYNDWNPDILTCGGGAYQSLDSPADPSCGRIRPLDDDAAWEMDAMPEGRVMVEGTLLPDGTVLFVNGANQGAQGFGLATSPTTEALIYDPTKPLGNRFSRGASSTIPRLYHSVALLLLDGTLLITGSNPFEMPVLSPNATNPYITDFRVEIYTPPYLSGDNTNRRPSNVNLSTITLTANSQQFGIRFLIPAGASEVKVALYHGGFVTHSVHMGHRMLFLDNTGWKSEATEQNLEVTMPPNSSIAPPGPYVIYVVVDGVPSVGQSVMVAL